MGLILLPLASKKPGPSQQAAMATLSVFWCPEPTKEVYHPAVFNLSDEEDDNYSSDDESTFGSPTSLNSNVLAAHDGLFTSTSVKSVKPAAPKMPTRVDPALRAAMDRFKYKANANIMTDSRAKLWDRVEALKGRTIDMGLRNKASIVLDMLQLYALLYVLVQSEWQYIWVQWTKPINFVNLDIWTYDSTFVSELYPGYGYIAYTLAWLGLVLIALTARCLCMKKSSVQQFLNALMVVAYLPTLLATGRIWTACLVPTQAPDGLTCGSVAWWMVMPVAAAAWVLLGMLLPLSIARKIKPRLIYSTIHDHEDHILKIELEYIVGLDDAWKHQSWSLWSSYTRRWAYFIPASLAYKALAVALVLLTDPADDEALQRASLWFFWLTLVPILLPMIVGSPFRSKSDNITYYLCGGILSGTAIFAWCDIQGFTSPLLLDSVLLVWLSAIAAVGSFALLVHIVRSTWIVKSDWPLTRHTLAALTAGSNAEFVFGILRAKALIERSYEAPPVLAPIGELSKEIQTVYKQYREARAAKSLLTHTLGDLLDDLIFVHNRKKPFSILPNKELEPHLEEFTRKVIEREERWILNDQRIKRISLKLLAFSAFVGHRRLAKLDLAQSPLSDLSGRAAGRPRFDSEFDSDEYEEIEVEVEDDGSDEDAEEDNADDAMEEEHDEGSDDDHDDETRSTQALRPVNDNHGDIEDGQQGLMKADHAELLNNDTPSVATTGKDDDDKGEDVASSDGEENNEGGDDGAHTSNGLGDDSEPIGEGAGVTPSASSSSLHPLDPTPRELQSQLPPSQPGALPPIGRMASGDSLISGAGGAPTLIPSASQASLEPMDGAPHEVGED